jgi:hypothetical protein
MATKSNLNIVKHAELEHLQAFRTQVSFVCSIFHAGLPSTHCKAMQTAPAAEAKL